jgi:DNA helicase-2/ATP-dependent DNA helicase PcrA
MIPFDIFLRALESVGRRPNQGQSDAVSAAKEASLFVVAGPGTGKTACLTMRMRFQSFGSIELSSSLRLHHATTQ